MSERLIANIAAAHGVTLADVLGPSRRAKVVSARYTAIVAVLRAKPSISERHLGQIFGRNHRTIHYALKAMGARTARSAPC